MPVPEAGEDHPVLPRLAGGSESGTAAQVRPNQLPTTSRSKPVLGCSLGRCGVRLHPLRAEQIFYPLSPAEEHKNTLGGKVPQRYRFWGTLSPGVA